MSTENPLFEKLQELSEDDLRQTVLIPILSKTPQIKQVTDVHGVNERGLDIILGPIYLASQRLTTRVASCES